MNACSFDPYYMPATVPTLDRLNKVDRAFYRIRAQKGMKLPTELAARCLVNLAERHAA